MALSPEGQVESFLVRVVREPGEGQGAWRIQMRHIQSGDCFHCLDIQELPALLRQVLERHHGAKLQGYERTGTEKESR
ncbi:hypothetical protein SY88_17005 [Clostridiales bacterium PH28_bin88]|nr:hypothetical protein SY88_17005 [Clostridiales bacterium PH28_bin88]